MIEDFHKEAAKNFSAKGKLLAESISATNVLLKSSFNGPEFHSVATWGEGDILGFRSYSRKEIGGREIARYGVANETTVGLEGEKHLDFVKLVENIHDIKQLKNVISFETLSDLCFIWMMKCRYDGEPALLTDFLLQRINKLVKMHSIAIPIYELRLESPKRLGKIELRPISHREIDKWCADVLSFQPKMKNQIFGIKEILRKKYQGKVAAFIEIEAEEKRAQEIALHEVEKSLAILRLFSIGILHPQPQSNCVPLGKEHSRRNVFFSFKGDMFAGESESMCLDSGGLFWNLTDDVFNVCWESGLQDLHNLVNEASLSSFDENLLKAVMIYSRVALSSDVANKLIYLFVALESILLKDTSEIISANISERAAFIIGRSVDERIAIKDNFKKAYALRSKFFHHGAAINQLTMIETFMHHVFGVFLEVLHYRPKFLSRSDFIESLERRKFQ